MNESIHVPNGNRIRVQSSMYLVMGQKSWEMQENYSQISII